jgi:hypothetical protein
MKQANPGRILGPRGQKQVGAAVFWELEEIAAGCSLSASGNCVLPMLICPRKRCPHSCKRMVCLEPFVFVFKTDELLKIRDSSGFFILNNLPNLQRESPN